MWTWSEEGAEKRGCISGGWRVGEGGGGRIENLSLGEGIVLFGIRIGRHTLSRIRPYVDFLCL